MARFLAILGVAYCLRGEGLIGGATPVFSVAWVIIRNWVSRRGCKRRFHDRLAEVEAPLATAYEKATATEKSLQFYGLLNL